jgi:hypothetical protein
MGLGRKKVIYFEPGSKDDLSRSVPGKHARYGRGYEVHRMGGAAKQEAKLAKIREHPNWMQRAHTWLNE